MQPRRILILTRPGDEHAFLVAQALELKGAEVQLCHTSDFPARQSISVRFHGHGAFGAIRGPHLDVDLSWPDVIWRRRPVPPVVPAIVDPLDRAFAARESGALSRGVWHLWGDHGFWVNPVEAAARAKHKVYQHGAAARAGFTLPDTLYGNDPEEIRAFVAAQPSGCVYKTLASPPVWKTADGGGAFAYTSRVRIEDLPEPDLLRAVPGIYQALVPKDHELRVMVMGASVFAARLESQKTRKGRLDWRKAYEELDLAPCSLPEAVAAACRRVLRELGLVFGCLDLIVTPEGDHVFLEANEMGQFLWVEDMGGPALLDPFTEFLLSADADFQYSTSGRPFRAAELWPAAQEAMAAAEGLHVVARKQVPDESVAPTGSSVATTPSPPVDEGPDPRPPEGQTMQGDSR